MKIILASDHAGFELKNKIKDFLNQEGFEVEDLGAHVYEEGDNYPELILPAAMGVISDPTNTHAIVFGKSGQGEAIICNRLPGARAVVYYGQNLEIIRLAREHNDSNILSIGAGFVGFEEAKEAIRLWISTPFSNDKRHVLRNEMLDTIE
jgi:ribose 5-phosphate isomerase B